MQRITYHDHSGEQHPYNHEGYYPVWVVFKDREEVPAGKPFLSHGRIELQAEWGRVAVLLSKAYRSRSASLDTHDPADSNMRCVHKSGAERRRAERLWRRKRTLTHEASLGLAGTAAL
jgi:hypothetical protein